MPAVALMALCLWLSDTPHLRSGLSGWDTLLRKGAHLTEFALLWLAWWWALSGLLPPDRPAAINGAAAIALTLWWRTRVRPRSTGVDVATDLG